MAKIRFVYEKRYKKYGRSMAQAATSANSEHAVTCCAINTTNELSQNPHRVSIDRERKNGRIPIQALLRWPMDGGFANSVARLGDDEDLNCAD
jgi:hypothetical protein